MNKIILFLFCVRLFAASELVVELSTRSHLTPIHLSPIATEKCSFDKNYIDELYAILSFDFRESGHARLVEKKGEGIGAVVKPIIKGSDFTLEVIDLRRNTGKSFSGIPLTGRLSIDRRRLHQVFDAASLSLFGEEGVASNKILYAIQHKHAGGKNNWLSEIWECDYDGANARQLTQENDYSITPIALPQGFLYVCYKFGPPKIFKTRYDKPKGEPVVSLRGNQLLPALSKAGDLIAYICDASGRADLFLQSFSESEGATGKPRQLYSVQGSVQASPSFSPDSTRLAFVSDKEGTPKIYIIDLTHISDRKRPNALCLTHKNRDNTGPSWSPDGRKIAYSAKTSGIRQIWLYDFDTGQERQLTKGPIHKENPSFAPDSLHLIYNTTGSDSSELYLMNLNDPSSPVKISGGSGKKHYPSWEGK